MTRNSVPLALLVVVTLAGCGGRDDPLEVAPTTTPTSAAGSSGSYEVDGRQLVLDCEGDGAPVVVLEPGEGESSSTFDDLASALADETTVCRYDRAGVGASDPAATPRTTAEMASDERDVLAAAGVEPPYVLVGTSAGASIVLHEARLHPDEVAGVLAINPVPLYDQWSARARPLMTADEWADEERYYAGDNGESIDYATSSAEAEDAPAPAAVPLVLLHSTVAQCEGETGGPCVETADLYVDLGEEYAAAWPGARFEAVDAAHDVHLVQPDLVLSLAEGLVSGSRT